MQAVYDYLIIGSGAGGSAAAYRLARSGAAVLLLERGHRLPRDGSTLDVGKVLREGAFRSKESFLDRAGKVIVPGEYANLGGKTKWYGAALLRFAPHEFAADPAHQCPAWPISYDDIAPYYAEAEALLGVRTFPVEPDLQKIVARFRANGHAWRDQLIPVGLAPEILAHPEEAKHFDGFASAVGLKSDGERLLERVRDRTNLSIQTGKHVAALVPSSGDPRRVDGVVCADGSAYRARRVLLAGGALHSPRLLQTYLETTGLAARLPAYANVGRNYKYHVLTAMLALSRRPVNDILRKTALLLSEEFPHSSVQNTGYVDGEILATEAPGLTPQWLSNTLGRRAYGFWLTTEDGSHPANRVSAANGAGRPTIDYDVRRLRPAFDEHRRMVRAVRNGLISAGYLPISKPIPIVGSAHACGTLMAGEDPRRSVVDAEGRVHGLHNLHAVDGSVLTRSSRANPALTIYAWSLRVADRLSRAPA